MEPDFAQNSFTDMLQTASPVHLYHSSERDSAFQSGDILVLMTNIEDGRRLSGHQLNHKRHLRGRSPKPSLRNRSKSRVSICVNINAGLDSFEPSIFLLLWGSHYRVTIFSQPFTSTVINHAPFNYWFVINILNPFQILLLIFTSFFNPIPCVLLITLLNCHRLFQQTC